MDELLSFITSQVASQARIQEDVGKKAVWRYRHNILVAVRQKYQSEKVSALTLATGLRCSRIFAWHGHDSSGFNVYIVNSSTLA